MSLMTFEFESKVYAGVMMGCEFLW